MLIRHFMATMVVRLDGRTPISEAWRVLVDHGLRRVPVVRGSQVLGVITEHELMGAMPRPGVIGGVDPDEDVRARAKRPVESLLKGPLVFVGPNDHVDDAARKMLEARVEALPVIDGGELVGVLTSSDLFRLFASAGGDPDSRRMSVDWPADTEEPDLLRAVFAEGARLHGLMRYRNQGGRTISVLSVSADRFVGVRNRLVLMGYVLIEGEKERRR